MNIPQLCSQLFRQGEHVRLTCKQVQSDLAQIFALQECDVAQRKELQRIYDDRVAQAQHDIAELTITVEEARQTVARLTSTVSTRPLPLVRL